MKRVLIIQTAFIGDVILATGMIEQIKSHSPEILVDFLLRAGNENLLSENPHINEILIWDKNQNKLTNLIRLLFRVREKNYDAVYCIQRFFNAGLLTALSGAKKRIGFHSNPMAFAFTKKIQHRIPHIDQSFILHEVQRNAQLLDDFPKISDSEVKDLRPKLYFSTDDIEKVNLLGLRNYVVIAPASVWYTKQWHSSKWKELINQLSHNYQVVIIGAPSEQAYIDELYTPSKQIISMAGKLTLKQSALVMQQAQRVFVNDSAPLHLASAVNAKTTALFCSTVKDFGYYPLSDDAVLIEVDGLSCRPCGLHGKSTCPKQHFKCAMDIEVETVLTRSFAK